MEQVGAHLRGPGAQEEGYGSGGTAATGPLPPPSMRRGGSVPYLPHADRRQKYCNRRRPHARISCAEGATQALKLT